MKLYTNKASILNSGVGRALLCPYHIEHLKLKREVERRQFLHQAPQDL